MVAMNLGHIIAVRATKHWAPKTTANEAVPGYTRMASNSMQAIQFERNITHGVENMGRDTEVVSSV